MKISFYPRSNSLYVRIYDKGEMARLSSGIKFPDHVRWLPSRECFQGSTLEVASLNAEVTRTKARVADLYCKHGSLQEVRKNFTTRAESVYDSEEQSYDLSVLLDQYVSRIESGDIRTKSNTLFRSASIRIYRASANIYNMFAQSNGSVSLDKFDLSGKDLHEKRELAAKFTAHFDKLSASMVRLGYEINSRATMMNIIRVIVRHYESELFLSLPRIKVEKMYETPILTLPQDFVTDFINDSHGRYDTYDDEYKYLWEMCATMLITSLRVSDAMAINPADIRVVDGKVILVKENKKTGIETALPLPKSLSSRFDYNMSKYESLFTPVKRTGSAVIKSGLKEFFATYEEMQEVITYKRSDYRGNRITVSERYCDMVHPHMLRKTAITMMLANGVSMEHVRFASGHKSKAIERYIGWVDKAHKSEISQYYKRVFGD